MARIKKAGLPLIITSLSLSFTLSVNASTTEDEVSLNQIEGVSEILADNEMAFPSAEEQLLQIQTELAHEEQGNLNIFCDENQEKDDFSTCIEQESPVLAE
ncbi:hypothetical protein [Shewanella waksmanii]|uniref:hypothetical protein n=1 Tax=Shewanella waksmanii TaxID=213783 RepID=UPI0037350E80